MSGPLPILVLAAHIDGQVCTGGASGYGQEVRGGGGGWLPGLWLNPPLPGVRPNLIWVLCICYCSHLGDICQYLTATQWLFIACLMSKHLSWRMLIGRYLLLNWSIGTLTSFSHLNQSIKIYIAPLQDAYSEALPTQAKQKRTVLRRQWRIHRGGAMGAIAPPYRVEIIFS